jgi:hypothetical protein
MYDRQRGETWRNHKAPDMNAFRDDVMASVFIYPIEDETAKSHYGNAVEKGVELQTVSSWIRDEIQMENLRRCYPDGTCYVWGVPDQGDNRSTWNAMSEDDLVLGYRNRSIVSAATVLMKIDHPSLAIALWGDQTERPPRLLSFFTKPHVGEVPIVEQMLGYLDQEFSGFTRLNPEKCENLLNAFGSLEIFVRLGLRYDFPFSFRHSE